MECAEFIESVRRIERAKLLFDQRRWKEAEAELRKAMIGGEFRATALYWLAWTLLRQDRIQEAETAADGAIAADPEMPGGYYVRAVALRKIGKLDQAEEAVRAAIRKDTHASEYRAMLGWMLLDAGRVREALGVADEGPRQSPEAVDLHQVRTEALRDLGKLDAAEESARHAVSLDPGDEVSMAQLGAIAFKQKDLIAAQEHYATALRIRPTYSYARNGLLETLRTRTWIYRLLAPKRKVKMTTRMYIAVVYLGVLGLVLAITSSWPAALLPALVCALAAFVLIRGYVGAAFNPLSTLALRLNPIGRAALSRDEIRCSNYVVLLLAGALLGFGLMAAGIWLGFLVGLLPISLVIPVAKTFQETGRRRRVAALYTLAMACAGVAGIVALALHQGTVARYSLCAFTFCWLQFRRS